MAKTLVLKGETTNCHYLEAEEISVETADGKAAKPSETVATETNGRLAITAKGLLVHYDPTKENKKTATGDHNTLEVEAGTYGVGRQVESNPFTMENNALWD